MILFVCTRKYLSFSFSLVNLIFLPSLFFWWAILSFPSEVYPLQTSVFFSFIYSGHDSSFINLSLFNTFSMFFFLNNQHYYVIHRSIYFHVLFIFCIFYLIIKINPRSLLVLLKVYCNFLIHFLLGLLFILIISCHRFFLFFSYILYNFCHFNSLQYRLTFTAKEYFFIWYNYNCVYVS